MRAMTVRGLNDSLAEKLKQTAKQEGKSVNQLVIETLKKKFNMEKEKKFTKTHHDLDHLFGIWSQEEFEMIQGKIDFERQMSYAKPPQYDLPTLPQYHLPELRGRRGKQSRKD